MKPNAKKTEYKKVEPFKLGWAEMLQKAVTEPGTIHQAYSLFHDYSLGNQLLALIQCKARQIEPGPIGSFMHWKTLGRSVKKGEKAITLCMPVTCKRRNTENSTETADEPETGGTFTAFVFKPNWYVLAQTEGAEYKPAALPDWDEARALAALEISKVPFDLADGNCQGYAARGRKVAVNPLAAMPYKTLFHELAHVLLGHTDQAGMSDGEKITKDVKELEAEAVAMLVCYSLGLPGAEYSRGYIQGWYKEQEIPERTAQRIFTTADKILQSGRPEKKKQRAQAPAEPETIPAKPETEAADDETTPAQIETPAPVIEPEPIRHSEPEPVRIPEPVVIAAAAGASAQLSFF